MSLKSFSDYLEIEKKYSPLTLKAYVRDVESFQNFILETYDVVGIEDVNYAQIRQWIVELVESGLSNRSINRKISSLNAYYKFLLRIETISSNPLVNHKVLKTSNAIQIPFSEKEVTAVLDAVADETDFESVRNKFIIELFYATGIRRIELVELKISDLDLSSKVLKVLGKRNKERYVPLISSVIETAQKYFVLRNGLETIGNKEHVFLTKKGSKIYETLVYRIINDYFSKASLKVKKSPHILRHSFATHLLNQGANLNAIKELLGHTSLAATQVYTHNSMSELKKVYEQSHPRGQKISDDD